MVWKIATPALVWLENKLIELQQTEQEAEVWGNTKPESLKLCQKTDSCYNQLMQKLSIYH